ncbi:reverse transcriptase domain-containing protein [Tanacetum coccineum]|uniref:Reverse transcriptase domain-containing protein n=1 Tax=Tanacetum coccineum TaxID=301880 RepID=A0ABQ5AE67_9ASTR
MTSSVINQTSSLTSLTNLTSPEVNDDIFDPEEDIIENLLNLDKTKDLPPYHDNPLSGNPTPISEPETNNPSSPLPPFHNSLSGSTTSSSPSLSISETSDYFLKEFVDELTHIIFPPGNDDLPFDAESDFREIEYFLNHVPIKEMDSILEDAKKYIKDPVEIYNIRQRDGESMEEFVRRKDKALAILMVQPWERVARQSIIQSFYPKQEFFFPPLGEDEGTKGPIIIEAKIGGHCVHQLSASARMNFMVIRSSSPYNGIIGRPGVRKLQAVPSTTHKMLKILVEGGVITLKSSKLVSLECAVVSRPEGAPSATKRIIEERIKVAINPGYPEQTVMIGSTLTEEGRNKLCGLLQRNLDIFAWKHVDMTSAIQEEVGKLVEAGIMKEVHYHDWLSNLVMVKKHDDSWRMCVNFKDLNKACPKDGYSLPKIDWKVESLCRFLFKYFLDTYKGYHQIQMAKEDEGKPAFITSQGIFCYTKMPFGLRNAGATYQHLVDKAFHKQIGRNLEVYVDDLVIKSCTEDEIVRDIEETFKTLREINMKLNPKKCTFGVEEGMFLGYKVNTRGLKVCLDKVDAILSLPSLKCLKDVQKLNGKLASLNKFLAKSAEKSLPPRVLVKRQILAVFIVERPDDNSSDTLMETKEELLEPWILFTDGSSCTDGSGAGLILTNPEGMEFTYALRFRFDATNNEAEYEALIAVLRIAEQIGVKNLQANVNSRLVANQVNEMYVAKEADMICYLQKVKALIGSFKAFSIKQIPRSENKKADALSKIALTSFAHLNARALIRACQDCQVYKPVPRNPQQKLTPITSPWTFYKWEIDIVGPLSEGPGKVKFLIVAMDYFTKWIEAKPVATITGNEIKKFVWDNIVCRFGLPGEIISDNGKQFRDDPFKEWCEKLCIHQHFASVKHPQTNGLVERANRSLGEGIKARLEARSKNWMEELPHVLWAHRTMIKSSNEDTPFSLTYGTEANNEALEINLDPLEERREEAAIREAKSKAKMEKYYNAKVRSTSFKPGDLVYRNNDASQVEDTGKLGPKWEGPYEVTEALGKGAYELRDRDGKQLPRTWMVQQTIKRCNITKC